MVCRPRRTRATTCSPTWPVDEERIIVKSVTGIRNTVVWKKLFKFQRDGVVGEIDKRERFGGCIIADSVGLGKTFEALAIIKYYKLRNDSVLVLAPRRLRDNRTLHKANDKRNVLADRHFTMFYAMDWLASAAVTAARHRSQHELPDPRACCHN